ncbi:MAG: hypothetical protein WEE89_02125 [Gemmatimonadota bacterium]
MPTFATLDASLLLTMGAASVLNVVWDNPRYNWHLTPIARNEIFSDPTRAEIGKALLTGRLATADLDTTSSEELAAFAQWNRIVDGGEAEAIAVSITRGGVVGIEDLFAQRKLTQLCGSASWVNCARLLLDAISDGRQSLHEADRVFKALDCYPGYVKRGISSLADLQT